MSATSAAGVPLLYTVRQVADLLNVSRAHVYNLMQSGDLEYVKIGASRRIEAQALEAFLAKLRQVS